MGANNSTQTDKKMAGQQFEGGHKNRTIVEREISFRAQLPDNEKKKNGNERLSKSLELVPRSARVGMFIRRWNQLIYKVGDCEKRLGVGLGVEKKRTLMGWTGVFKRGGQLSEPYANGL